MEEPKLPTNTSQKSYRSYQEKHMFQSYYWKLFVDLETSIFFVLRHWTDVDGRDGRGRTGRTGTDRTDVDGRDGRYWGTTFCYSQNEIYDIGTEILCKTCFVNNSTQKASPEELLVRIFTNFNFTKIRTSSSSGLAICVEL